MRTDVKVGLVCAFAIVLGVIIFFVVRGKSAPVAARAEVNTSHTAANSDLRPANAGTPSNPTASSSDPILPDHMLAGNPIGGGVIAPPGAVAPTPAPSVATAPSTLTSLGTAGTPSSSTTSGTPLTSVTSMPFSLPTPPLTSTPLTPLGPTMVLGSGNLSTPTSTSLYPPSSATGATTYKIQKGDMLAAIAKKNNVSVKALEAANPRIDPTRLKINDVIKIPAATLATGTPAQHPAPTTSVATPGHPASTSLTSAHPTTPTTLKPGAIYVIKKGDTLASISKAAYGNASGTTKIFRANRGELDDPDVMPVGASIKIP